MTHLSEIIEYINNIEDSWFIFIFFIALYYPLLVLMRKVLFFLIKNTTKIKGEIYGNIFNKYKLVKHLTHSFIALYILFWSEILEQGYLWDHLRSLSKILDLLLTKVKDIIISVYCTIAFSRAILASINAYVDIFRIQENLSKSNVTLYAHILRFIVVISTIIVLIANILNVSVRYLFTSIGAAAAFLAFVFKDTLLGLVASLQISLQDIIKIGDIITLPSYDLDGTIEEITITVVKVRNFDETLSSVPTTVFVNNLVKNWRFMHERGGRRIKRSINIDIKTISICSEEILLKISNFGVMQNFVTNNPSIFNMKDKITNVQIFKQYLTEYLKECKQVHQEDFLFLVRQKTSTPQGLPIEIYIFSKNTDFIDYEDLQYEIFSHIFSVLNIFELKVFQSLSTINRPN